MLLYILPKLLAGMICPNYPGDEVCKACAEPAMSLITSPYLAVKNAIYAARKEVGRGDAWSGASTRIWANLVYI